MRQPLQRQLTKIRNKYRENWCAKIAEEMQVAAASGSGQRLFELIHNAGGRRSSASETMCNRSG